MRRSSAGTKDLKDGPKVSRRKSEPSLNSWEVYARQTIDEYNAPDPTSEKLGAMQESLQIDDVEQSDDMDLKIASSKLPVGLPKTNSASSIVPITDNQDYEEFDFRSPRRTHITTKQSELTHKDRIRLSSPEKARKIPKKPLDPAKSFSKLVRLRQREGNQRNS